MNRRDLVKLGATQAAIVAVPGGMALQAAAKTTPSDHVQTVTLSNAQFELFVSATEKLQCSLHHRPTGTVLAEGTIDQVSTNDRVVEVYLGR